MKAQKSARMMRWFSFVMSSAPMLTRGIFESLRNLKTIFRLSWRCASIFGFLLYFMGKGLPESDSMSAMSLTPSLRSV